MNTFSRILWVGVVVVGCSKKKEEKPDKPAPAKAITESASLGSATAPVTKDLPEPPADVRKGDSRVVNLLTDEAGKPVTVDVWGKRSFEYGPTSFAKDIAYGQATPHFGIPKGMSTIVIAAGADMKDRKSELGSVWASKEGEEVTTVVFRDGASPRSMVMGMKPEGLHNAPAAPPAGKGMIYIYANPLTHVEAKLKEKFGGSTFYVGDGSDKCLRQRVEESGQKGFLLGGTNTTTHDVAPGKVKVTFHKWEPGKDCTTPPVFETEVEVADGKGTFVILHSPDGGVSLAAMQLPMWK